MRCSLQSSTFFFGRITRDSCGAANERSYARNRDGIDAMRALTTHCALLAPRALRCKRTQ